MKYELFKNEYSKHLPFWDKLSENDKMMLSENSVKKNFKKGITVFDGNSDNGVFILNKGCLRVYMVSEDGKELTLQRIHDGDMCILSASCVSDPITFDLFIDTEEDCECCYIFDEVFTYINNKYSDARIFALETTVESFNNMMWIMEQILFMSMDKRLAIFLLDEITRIDTDTVMLTHSLIAKYMGSAREVVSRMLKYFENEGIVELSRRGVKILDKKRLRELTI